MSSLLSTLSPITRKVLQRDKSRLKKVARDIYDTLIYPSAKYYKWVIAEILGDPYRRQVPLPRIPDNRAQDSTRDPSHP